MTESEEMTALTEATDKTLYSMVSLQLSSSYANQKSIIDYMQKFGNEIASRLDPVTALKEFRCITLSSPRQTGKSEWVKRKCVEENGVLLRWSCHGNDEVLSGDNKGKVFDIPYHTPMSGQIEAAIMSADVIFIDDYYSLERGWPGSIVSIYQMIANCEKASGKKKILVRVL